MTNNNNNNNNLNSNFPPVMNQQQPLTTFYYGSAQTIIAPTEHSESLKQSNEVVGALPGGAFASQNPALIDTMVRRARSFEVGEWHNSMAQPAAGQQFHAPMRMGQRSGWQHSLNNGNGGGGGGVPIIGEPIQPQFISYQSRADVSTQLFESID